MDASSSEREAPTRAARPTAAPPTPPEEGAQRRKPVWRELPVLVIVAFAVALLIKTFLLQAFYIPSGSMNPTLVRNDRVLVEKVSQWFGEPGRGDVIVFERGVAGPPGDDDESVWKGLTDAVKELFGFPTDGTDLIKRVIATEGETVQAAGGRVLVDGEPIEEPYLPEDTSTERFGPIDVPEGTVFVMGDNRDGSDDSRVFGPIPTDSIVGRAFVIVWPPGDIGGL
ncbi:MAG: signal peptidase I [Actinomycetota bacterium]